MIVMLTDKQDNKVPVNSKYFVTAKVATGHGKQWESVVYLAGDSALKEINVKETAKEVGEMMSGSVVKKTVSKQAAVEPDTSSEPTVLVTETLPEGIKRGKDGKLRESGKLISNEKLEEMGLSNN